MDYSYDYGMNFSEAQLMEFLDEFGPMIIGAVAVVVLIALIWAAVVYVLTAMGFYTVAKRRGIQNPWLAWIPVADAWILGCISDQYQYVVKGKVKNKRKILLGLAITSFCVSFIMNLVSNLMMAGGSEEMITASVAVSSLTSLITAGIGITNMVFQYMALYDFYSSASPENNVLFLVLGIIFGFLQPFFIFFNRKKDNGMPPRKPEPQTYAQPEPYAPPQPVTEMPPAAPETDPWDRPDGE